MPDEELVLTVEDRAEPSYLCIGSIMLVLGSFTS